MRYIQVETIYSISRADPGFLERGGPLTESGGPNNLGGSVKF